MNPLVLFGGYFVVSVSILLGMHVYFVCTKIHDEEVK